MKDPPPIPRVLTIAGSDSSGAAGVQADLKTFEGRGVYGMSALTMLTAQNSSGIQAIHPLPPEFIAQQIDSVLSDVGADAIKTGLLLQADAIRLAANKAEQYKIKALIVDPVLIDGHGRKLIDDEAERAYRERLIPNALVVTPNLGEAKILSGRNIRNLLDMRSAAQAIAALGVQWVVVK